jgi:short-subunit dehydrogenase
MDKMALITGTTSGIGKAFAERLAYEHYNLILVSRDKLKLSKQAQDLSNRYGISVFEIPIDLIGDKAAHTVFETVQKLGLSVQLLINNAGFNECGTFPKTNSQKEIDMIHLHIICTTEMMKLFLPEMIKNQYGRILNLGSTGSFIPCPYDAVYAATKAYILFVSKGINAELKGTGVSITTLCPGSTRTEFAKKAGIEKTLLFRLFVMTPEAVAKAGYKALLKGKASIIPGLYNKMQVLSSKILPSSLVNSLTKIMLKKEDL